MISLQQLKPATVFPVYDRIIPQYLLFSCDIPHLKKIPKSGNNLNRPVFPGEDLICELRLPDHCFRWRHNKLFLLLPEEYGPAFPAIVDSYTSPPTWVWPAPLLFGFSRSYGVLPPLCKGHWCSPPPRCHTGRLYSLLMCQCQDYWPFWGCRRFPGLLYHSSPHCWRYILGLTAPGDDFIRRSLYHLMQASTCCMNFSGVMPDHLRP